MLQRVQADRDVLSRFQNDVFTKFGARDADPESPDEQFWPCSLCHRNFSPFQAVRRHEAGALKIQRVSYLYLDNFRVYKSKHH